MKIIVPLVMGSVLITGYAPTAHAGIIWNNGTPASVTGNCDSSPDVCNGPAGNSGWTVFDDFTLTDSTTITGFTFDSQFVAGSAADYLSTNWSIWDQDPLNVFGFPPLFTGNAVATLSIDSSGAVTVTDFSVTGLSLDLTTIQTYWLGYSNVLNNDGAKTVAVLSSDTTDNPGYEQESNDGTVPFNHTTGNTVFTVEGTVDAPVGEGTPEPETWILMAAGLACVAKYRNGR